MTEWYERTGTIPTNSQGSLMKSKICMFKQLDLIFGILVNAKSSQAGGIGLIPAKAGQ